MPCIATNFVQTGNRQLVEGNWNAGDGMAVWEKRRKHPGKLVLLDTSQCQEVAQSGAALEKVARRMKKDIPDNSYSEKKNFFYENANQKS